MITGGEAFALFLCPHPQEIAIQEKNKTPMSVACSQTLYFLFKVRRARVIKYKPQGIYWLLLQGGRGGEEKIDGL